MTKKRHPKPTPEQKAGRVIRKAAQVLADRNWIQGKIGYPDYGMCAVGVINFAIVGDTAGYDTNNTDRLRLVNIATRHFSSWLKEIGANGGGYIPSWNDTKGRTKEEVILYMNKFADEMDPQIP